MLPPSGGQQRSSVPQSLLSPGMATNKYSSRGSFFTELVKIHQFILLFYIILSLNISMSLTSFYVVKDMNNKAYKSYLEHYFQCNNYSLYLDLTPQFCHLFLRGTSERRHKTFQQHKDCLCTIYLNFKSRTVFKGTGLTLYQQ